MWRLGGSLPAPGLRAQRRRWFGTAWSAFGVRQPCGWRCRPEAGAPTFGLYLPSGPPVEFCPFRCPGCRGGGFFDFPWANTSDRWSRSRSACSSSRSPSWFRRSSVPRCPLDSKSQPYECGENPVGSPWGVQFNIRFYVFALVFLIFDVEAVMLLPWALAYLDLGAWRAGRRTHLHRDSRSRARRRLGEGRPRVGAGRRAARPQGASGSRDLFRLGSGRLRRAGLFHRPLNGDFAWI